MYFEKILKFVKVGKGVTIIVVLFLSGRLGVCPPVTIAPGLAKTRQK